MSIATGFVQATGALCSDSHTRSANREQASLGQRPIQ